MSRKIRTTPSHGFNLTFGGWFLGKGTYLWVGTAERNYLGHLSGQKLYRLAKAIVRQFEEAQ